MFEYFIIGTMPPPVGGVSTYCKRKYLLMCQRHGEQKVAFLDLSKRANLIKVPLVNSRKIEVNSLNFFLVFILFFCGKISKCRFVDHNASRHYKGLKKRMLLRMLSHAGLVYVVKSELSEFYGDSLKTEVVSPFLPPSEEEESDILSNYPSSLLKFFEKDNILLNSAWKYVPYGDSDLYGIESSIKLLESNNDLNMVLCIGANYEDVSNGVRKRIESLISVGRLYLLEGQHQIWPLFKRYRPICLRLTPTDGDSVTVREAIYFRCLVVASDSIKRPSSCRIYKYGDHKSLMQEIEKLL